MYYEYNGFIWIVRMDEGIVESKGLKVEIILKIRDTVKIYSVVVPLSG